jgi:hypothetical protein
MMMEEFGERMKWFLSLRKMGCVWVSINRGFEMKRAWFFRLK